MKINFAKYDNGKDFIIEDELKSDSFSFPSNYRIKQINSCNVIVKFHKYDELINVSLKVKGEAVVICSFTNEPFTYRFHNEEDMVLSKQESEGSFYYQNDNVDFDEYIIALVDASIPLSPVKPGAKMSSDGANYRIISESELRKERKETIDHRWDVLEELENK